MNKKLFKTARGFSLFEVLVYVGILSITGALLSGLLINVTETQGRQNATTEVNQQINFVIQTVQRLVRESSLIETASGEVTSTLILRMEEPTEDPTRIYLQDGVIYLKRGTQPVHAITDDRVVVDEFNFFKTTNSPNHDSVQIELTMRFNTENPRDAYNKKIISAVSGIR